jgi:hypothetical protein
VRKVRIAAGGEGLGKRRGDEGRGDGEGTRGRQWRMGSYSDDVKDCIGFYLDSYSLRTNNNLIPSIFLFWFVEGCKGSNNLE